MSETDAIKWIESLIQDIGQLQYQGLWHYEQALFEIKQMLEEQEHESDKK